MTHIIEIQLGEFIFTFKLFFFPIHEFTFTDFTMDGTAPSFFLYLDIETLHCILYQIVKFQCKNILRDEK